MKKFVSVLILLSCVFLLSSCDSIGKNIKEESIEKIVGKIIGEEVDVTIVTPTADPADTSQPQATEGLLEGIIESEADGEIPWPEDIPSNVPSTDLTIKSKIKTPNGVILDFGETDISKVSQYSDILKQYMYEVIREDISEKKFDALYRKDETTVNVYWYEAGGFSLMITWK